ncbi:hypothetical protein ACOMHN_014258 [Nucella lapillus]
MGMWRCCDVKRDVKQVRDRWRGPAIVMMSSPHSPTIDALCSKALLVNEINALTRPRYTHQHAADSGDDIQLVSRF